MRSAEGVCSDGGKRFSLVNLGCKVNRVESDDAAAMLLSAGWVPAVSNEASLIIVNTCTVTGEAEKKTRKAVNRALSSSESACVLVTGCASAICPEAFSSLSPRVRVVPKAKLMSVVRDIACDSSECEFEGDAAKLLRAGEGFNTRIGVKIQDGCAHACTYCIVHKARGKPWSKPAARVCEEVRAYAQAGAKEVILTGINLGSYRDSSVGFVELLQLLVQDIARVNETREAGQGMRVRLSSIEPMDVSDGLIELIAHADGLICRHLHLPVQSGSSKVLSEMHRPYSAEGYLSLVERLRASIPRIALSTDIIAGFPGESEGDFADSVALCRQAGFSRMHVFPYSRREDTPAAARADQVADELKAARAKELRALAEHLRLADRVSRSGSVERALMESSGIAMTESYYEVSPVGHVPPNTFFAYRF